MKVFADKNFKFNENDIYIKFKKRIENTVGKGEIAHLEQYFSASPTVISEDLYCRPV